jgi:hypothetical protein
MTQKEKRKNVKETKKSKWEKNEKLGWANDAWKKALAEATSDESFKEAREAVLKMIGLAKKGLKIGDTVRMTKKHKKQQKKVYNEWRKKGLMLPSDIDNIDEFGDCRGVIIGLVFEDTDEFVDVRWLPSGLKYGYRWEDLEKC